MNLQEKKIMLLKELSQPLGLDLLLKLIKETDESKFDKLIAECFKKLDEYEDELKKSTPFQNNDRCCKDEDYEEEEEDSNENNIKYNRTKEDVFEANIIYIMESYPSHWKCKSMSVEDNIFTFTYTCDGIVNKDSYEFKDNNFVYIGSDYAPAKSSKEALEILIPLVDKVKNESTVQILNNMIRIHTYSL